MTPPTGCIDAPSSGETVDQISTSVVSFYDPRGVAGTGFPSGGQYPKGVVTYVTVTRQFRTSWSDTCTLLATQKSLCTAELDLFVSDYGMCADCRSAAVGRGRRQEGCSCAPQDGQNRADAEHADPHWVQKRAATTGGVAATGPGC